MDGTVRRACGLRADGGAFSVDAHQLRGMTTEPLDWIEPFIEAGADGFIFCFDSTNDPAGVIRAIKSHGKKVGVSLLLSEPSGPLLAAD